MKIVIVLLLSLVSFPVFAENTEDSTNKEQTFTQVRSGKKVFGSVGLGIADGFGVAASAGVYLTAKDMIEITYLNGSLDVIVAKTEVVYYGLHYKRFLMDTFYMNGGPAFRRYTKSTDVIDAIFGNKKGDAVFEDYGLDIAFGSQWDFQGSFMMNVDWVGVFIPLAKRRYNDLAKTQNAPKASLKFTVFSFGLSF